MRAKAPQNCTDLFGIIERDMLAGPWVLGEQFTTADPYLFFFTRVLERVGVDVSNFPKVRNHFERMKLRPAVERALAREGELLGAN
jgi:glutathione S-transferase